MKRSIYLLVVVGLISGVAGGVAAKVNFSHREQVRVEEASFAERTKAKLPGIYFTGLLEGANEVRISDGVPNERRDPRFSDSVWISKLAKILSEASYEPRPHGLWISSPSVDVYRSEQYVFTVMALGKILRVSGPRGGGDFIVGEETTAAFYSLVRELAPTKSVD